VLADDPSLTVRDVPPPRVAPARIVFDSSLRLPLTSTLARTARDVPTIVVAKTADPSRVALLTEAGVTVIVANTIDEALRALRAREIRSVLLEGGARLAGSFLEAAAVDRLVIFKAPVVLGDGALPAFEFTPPRALDTIERAPLLEQRAIGDDLMTVHALRAVPCLPD
jgi:diaminohydroxyphosphoribosylaminopyrimidine deaminase/5-amino-6-(5-phosphoribosylamino)uracil reductase